MCPMANRIAWFGSHERRWIPSETLEPVFHRVFIWHLIGEEDSCPGDVLSSPIMCEMKVPMKHWWKHSSTCMNAECAGVSGNILPRLSVSWTEWQSFCLPYVSYHLSRGYDCDFLLVPTTYILKAVLRQKSKAVARVARCPNIWSMLQNSSLNDILQHRHSYFVAVPALGYMSKILVSQPLQHQKEVMCCQCE